MRIATLLTIFVLFSAMVTVAYAHTDINVTDVENIIKQRIPCSQLTDEQLEAIGDYYMELMHPGQAHVIMDQMMGGEGSESLRQMHIAMAMRIYCQNESYYFEPTGNPYFGMMGGMMMYPYWGWGMGYFTFFFFILVLLLILILLAASSTPQARPRKRKRMRKRSRR